MSTVLLTPQDVTAAQALIRRLCQLQREVAFTLDPKHDRASDCFCGESGFWPLEVADGFRNEGHAVEFIEQATRDALVRLQENRP